MVKATWEAMVFIFGNGEASKLTLKNVKETFVTDKSSDYHWKRLLKDFLFVSNCILVISLFVSFTLFFLS
jgi:hypothetical protein